MIEMFNVAFICTHSLSTDWDIEILNEELKEENEWVERGNGVLDHDRQLWRRENYDTWSFFKCASVKYSMDLFSKRAFLPYRSECITIFNDEKLKNRICLRSSECGEPICERVLRSSACESFLDSILSLDIFSSRLDLLLLDKELLRAFPELWGKWS